MQHDTDFRQRLVAVLRTCDVKQVSDFLVAEGQWQPGMPANAELAMWMMIAGNPNLRDLHEQARQWLVAHGHEEEASMLGGREAGGKSRKSSAFLNEKAKPSRPQQSRKKPGVHIKKR